MLTLDDAYFPIKVRKNKACLEFIVLGQTFMYFYVLL